MAWAAARAGLAAGSNSPLAARFPDSVRPARIHLISVPLTCSMSGGTLVAHCVARALRAAVAARPSQP